MKRIAWVLVVVSLLGCQDAATPTGSDSPAFSVVSRSGELIAYLWASDASSEHYVGRTVIVTGPVAVPVELCFTSASTVRSLIVTRGSGAETALVAYDVHSSFPPPEPGERFRITGQSSCDGWLVLSLERLPGRL